MIFLDFAKAFDRVLHRRLLAKLRAHGIDGLVLRCIESWLHCRLQRVCLDGHSSRWHWCSVVYHKDPSWDHCYFLMFVNDIESNIKSTLLKFAVDTKVFAKVNNMADRQRTVAV